MQWLDWRFQLLDELLTCSKGKMRRFLRVMLTESIIGAGWNI
jgi:hypothetical protein